MTSTAHLGRHVLAAGWTLGMAIALAVPLPIDPSLPGWDTLLAWDADKVFHAALVAAHAAFLAGSFAALPRLTARPRGLALGIAALYGVGLELLQATVPGRQASRADVIADLAGVLAVGLWWRARATSEVAGNLGPGGPGSPPLPARRVSGRRQPGP